ncbi:unnamed protein product [marine sediment metagenome]|uniref:Uncharacterized protein n=1 Tax=marine sediment metagenome TaxID=412755 RepID=X1CDS9_9ZZZZ
MLSGMLLETKQAFLFDPFTAISYTPSRRTQIVASRETPDGAALRANRISSLSLSRTYVADFDWALALYDPNDMQKRSGAQVEMDGGLMVFNNETARVPVGLHPTGFETERRSIRP